MYKQKFSDILHKFRSINFGGPKYIEAVTANSLFSLSLSFLLRFSHYNIFIDNQFSHLYLLVTKVQ